MNKDKLILMLTVMSAFLAGVVVSDLSSSKSAHAQSNNEIGRYVPAGDGRMVLDTTTGIGYSCNKDKCFVNKSPTEK